MQGDHHQSGQQSKNGRSGRNAPGPATQAGFTIEDHLRDSMQSPAVRMVGAYIISILVLGGVAFLNFPTGSQLCPNFVPLRAPNAGRGNQGKYLGSAEHMLCYCSDHWGGVRAAADPAHLHGGHQEIQPHVSTSPLHSHMPMRAIKRSCTSALPCACWQLLSKQAASKVVKPFAPSGLPEDNPTHAWQIFTQ